MARAIVSRLGGRREREAALAVVRACRRRRGFTLVEMVVALAAGLLVSMAAFLLARNAASFFQHEARLSAAQFSTMVAMARLQTDLRRASLMSSPNVGRDPYTCGKSPTWPAGLQELAGIRIEEGGSAKRYAGDNALNTGAPNNLNPDAIIVGGLAGGSEMFSIQALVPGGTGFTILLQWDGALWRTKLAAQAGGTALNRIFVPGRFIRVLDDEGNAAYGVITGLNETGSNPEVSVAAVPALATRATAVTCGCINQCVGNLVNPISRVLYLLRDIRKHPAYKGMFPKPSHDVIAQHKGVAEPLRTELVRTELDAQGTELFDTIEVLAEHAVDLKFGVTVAQPGGAPDYIPTIARYAIGAKAGYDQAASLAANGRPEYVSSVQVRLSTRGSRRDRDVGMPVTADGGLLRYSLGAGNGFVRLRTMIADVSLPNQSGVSWPP